MPFDKPVKPFFCGRLEAENGATNTTDNEIFIPTTQTLRWWGSSVSAA